MAEGNVEIVRRGYELFSRGDLAGVAALFAEEAEMPGAGGLGIEGTGAGTVQGPEGFLRAIEETVDIFEDYVVETEQFIDSGNAVIVEVRISGRGRVSGVPQETRLAHLWVLRDGKVIHGQVHRTVEEARAAVPPGNR